MDNSIQFLLMQLSKCETSSEIHQLLDSEEFQFRFDAGVTVPSASIGIEQKDEIVHSLVMHYLVYTCKAELDQLTQGLSELGVLRLLHSYPTLFRPLFTASHKPKLTADQVSMTFSVQWSPRGSNQREAEEAVIFGWMEYLDGVKGKGCTIIRCLCITIRIVCLRPCLFISTVKPV